MKTSKQSIKLLCLEVNEPSCNWSLWRCTPRHRLGIIGYAAWL